ncbi:hypothetical protein F5Y13DRAFT_200683 [Hypoxylon sp. FL1857]|nr:hypothetical protein F5Y13DRAFT_200683 [Hypoxylon sp. FL1857]
MYPNSTKQRAPSPGLDYATEYYVDEERPRRAKRSRPEGESEVYGESSSVDVPTKKLILTGEYRTPFSERIQAMRRGEHERAQECRNRGSVSDRLNALAIKTSRRTPSPPGSTSAPAPPSTPLRPAAAEVCPGAPQKARKFDRNFLGRGSSCSDGNEDDYLFDRWANKPENVLRKKKSADLSNERCRRGITTPDHPSPLRSSFNAEEMEKISAQLDALSKRMSSETRRTDSPTGYPRRRYPTYRRDSSSSDDYFI